MLIAEAMALEDGRRSCSSSCPSFLDEMTNPLHLQRRPSKLGAATHDTLIQPEAGGARTGGEQKNKHGAALEWAALERAAGFGHGGGGESIQRMMALMIHFLSLGL